MARLAGYNPNTKAVNQGSHNLVCTHRNDPAITSVPSTEIDGMMIELNKGSGSPAHD